MSRASEHNRYHIVDTFSLVSGAHTPKVGVDFLRLDGHALYNQQFNGAYAFSSLAAWESRTPTSYIQFTGTGARDHKSVRGSGVILGGHS